MSYTIKQIAEQVHAQVQGNENLTINRILTDSRSLCFPEDTLFFALKSKRGDGHRYVHELYARGVRAFVVSHLPDKSEAMADAAFLLTDNPQKALQKLAEMHRTQFNIPVIGITGSNGKTVVKEWLYQLLGDTRHITRSPRSYNSQTGVPLSVWMLNEQTELGIFEAGISEMGEMDALPVKPKALASSASVQIPSSSFTSVKGVSYTSTPAALAATTRRVRAYSISRPSLVRLHCRSAVRSSAPRNSA